MISAKSNVLVLPKSSVFKYFNLQLKLITEQLGTCTEASIYAQHILEKAKKEIAAANRLAGKLTKKLAKYKGTELEPWKEVAELQGILCAYMELTGIKHDLPNDVLQLLAVAVTIKDEWEKAMAESDVKPTVFMRNADGHAIISSHMILGNIKENLRIMTNNGDKEIAKSKVSVGEMGALDFKVVEDFLTPSNDVVRDASGKPVLLERPISFERMGKRETAIVRSERLPVGTEYTCTLRVRAESPLADPEVLRKLFDCGKNNGLGQWRGSGKKGSYAFNLNEIENYVDPSIPEGWS